MFVQGTKTGEVVDKAMKELVCICLRSFKRTIVTQRPHAISFSKKNTIHPAFEDVSSLEFWAQKNDASMFVIGQSMKKNLRESSSRRSTRGIGHVRARYLAGSFTPTLFVYGADCET